MQAAVGHIEKTRWDALPGQTPAREELPYRGALQPESMVRYIVDNCADITLSQVGEHFGCHPNSVTRLLRQTGAGASFRDVLTRARIERACSLLARGHTVEQAARSCGYTNLSHFYTAFHRIQHCTPGSYRLLAIARR